MGFFTYLATPSPQLGTLGWLFFIAQILGVAAGAYLYFVHTERNAARAVFMRQMGIALLVLGGVGIVMGALRMLNVPILNQHVWFYVQALVELGMAGYVIYYMRSVLPELERQASRSRSGGRGAPVRTLATDAPPVVPRPIATTSRRDARRDRKRKGR